MRATPGTAVVPLEERIVAALETEPLRPWCVHRLYEEIAATGVADGRDDGLLRTQLVADHLAENGRAQRESVSTVSIGVHCEDSLYWSVHSDKHQLEEFGPEYESPAILYRLASHFQCHGL